MHLVALGICASSLSKIYLTVHKSRRKVHLDILSYHEGKEDIIRAAQEFCIKVKNKEAQSEVMDIEHFSHLLEGNGHFI